MVGLGGVSDIFKDGRLAPGKRVSHLSFERMSRSSK